MVADRCGHPGWECRAALHHSQLSQALNDGSATAVATLAQLMASDMAREQAQSRVDRMINQQAYTMAVTDVFSLSAVRFFALVAMDWLSKPTLGAGAGDAGGAH